MSCSIDIVAFKKSVLEEMKEIVPSFSFREIYSCFLESQTLQDEENVSEDERLICSVDRDIIGEFLGNNYKFGESMLVDESTYVQYYNWLEEKLKNRTLFSFVDDKYHDIEYIRSLLEAYKAIRDEKVDFETEFIVICVA